MNEKHGSLWIKSQFFLVKPKWVINSNCKHAKINSGLSIIRKLRDIVDYNTLIIIYKSIIQPRFDYCSQVWGGLGKVLSDKL